MKYSIRRNQQTTPIASRWSTGASIVVMAATGVLGACAVAGSFVFQWQGIHAEGDSLVQWQRIHAESDSLDALLAEQVARATLEELGVPVSPDRQTKHVHSLNFFDCKEPDDATLQKLAALPHVVDLNLNDCTITDKQLRHVCGLPKLICLSLKGTRVSDNGLAELADSLDLVALYLSNTRISDEGLRHIARMRRLWIVDLRNTLATEEGLRHLRHMDRLDVLMLSEISDAGVPYLMEMENLKRLSVNHNRISQHKLRQLKRAMPKLAIDIFPGNVANHAPKETESAELGIRWEGR